MTAYWQRSGARQRSDSYGVRFDATGDPDRAWRNILRLPPTAELTAQQIRSAYLETVKRTHPDAGGDVDAFIRAKEARDGLLGKLPGG